MDLNTPELTRIFKDELDERSGHLVAGARSLQDGNLDQTQVQDLIRDAHTIKGSAGLLGYDQIREIATRLEYLWKLVSEGYSPPLDVVVAMEASAGRLLPSITSGDTEMLAEFVGKLVAREDGDVDTSPAAEVVPLRRPDPGNLGGLLSSVSDSLLGGNTRVDTGDLYRLINRIVEVSLDSEALADLSLVSIEGSDPALFRKSWRHQLERLSSSIADIQDQAVSLANISFQEATATFPQFVRYLGRRMGKDVRFELSGEEVQLTGRSSICFASPSDIFW